MHSNEVIKKYFTLKYYKSTESIGKRKEVISLWGNVKGYPHEVLTNVMTQTLIKNKVKNVSIRKSEKH